MLNSMAASASVNNTFLVIITFSIRYNNRGKLFAIFLNIPKYYLFFYFWLQ